MDDSPDNLLERLGAADHLVRLGAIERLITLGRDDGERVLAVEVCAAALSAPNPTARSAAAQVAAAAGLRALVGPLLRVAADRHEAGRARKSAVLALGELGATDAVEAAIDISEHSNAMYRRAAIEALGRIGSPEALRTLCDALGDEAWQVRMYAAIGLGGPVADEAPEVAVTALLDALAAETDAATAEQLLRSLADLGRQAPRCAMEIGERLAAVLEQPPAIEDAWMLQRAAARGLGELGAKAWAPLLRRLVEGVDAVVAEEIHWALRILASG